MDHIPLPLDREPFTVEVPYLPDQAPPYDKRELGAFLKRYEEETQPSFDDSGIEVDSEAGGDGTDLYGVLQELPHSSLDMLAIAQAWLYFDTLRDVFGPHFSQEQFIRQQPGLAPLITTTQLCALIRSKNRDLHTSSCRAIPQWARDEVQKIRRVSGNARARQVRFALYLRTTDDPYKDTWAKISFAITLMLEALYTVHAVSSKKPFKGTLAVRTLPDLRLPAERPVRAGELLPETHMLRVGHWCVHQINDLSSRLSLSTLTYLANLKRNARDGLGHGHCQSSDRCAAYDSQAMACESTHMKDCSGCEHVNAPTTELERILESGGIPVLSCKRTVDGDIAVSYVCASPSLHYAAISHLWADGLGNTQSNSLPFCQLDRLLIAVAKVDLRLSRPLTITQVVRGLVRFNQPVEQTVLLWLDVYCVPVLRSAITSGTAAVQRFAETPAARAKRLKKIAIARMDATYSWAKFVLVLDVEIARITSRADELENMARIATCAWNSRCWTFQEHFLAKTIVFEREHKHLVWNTDSYAPEPGKASAKDHDYDIIRVILNDFLKSTAKAVKDTYYLNDLARFTNSWNAFAGRTTTKWEDTLGIFANLLHLGAGEILGLGLAVQMNAILATQGKLPLALLSHHSGRPVGSISVSQHRQQNSFARPGDCYIPWRENGYAMEVTPDGFLLHPDLISPFDHAKLIRLPIQRGSKWTFKVKYGSAQPRNIYRFYWLRLDRRQLDCCNLRSDRLIILLDSIFDRGDDNTRTGAWFLPTRANGDGITGVTYGGLLTWGVARADEARTRSGRDLSAEVLRSANELILIEEGKAYSTSSLYFIVLLGRLLATTQSLISPKTSKRGRRSPSIEESQNSRRRSGCDEDFLEL